MKFSCLLSSLSEIVNNVSLAISPKTNTIPALEGILLESISDKQLKITGYDLDIGIIGSLQVDIIEEGAIVLNAQILKEILRKMAGPVVNISVNSKFITVISDNETEYKIIGIDPKDYPSIPQLGVNKTLAIKDNILKTMISQTLFAVSQNPTQNPILCGSMFKVEKGCLTLVSVDGYRVALSKRKIETTLDDTNFVVPSKALNEICKLLSEEENSETTIEISQSHVLFKIGGYFIITRLLEGSFIDYEAAIPKKSSTTIVTDPKEFTQRIERVSIMVTNRISVVMKVESDKILLQCESTLGQANDMLSVQMSGEPIEKIAFNNRYMLEALKHAECEKIKINMDGPVMPIKIEPVSGDEFLYLVLPVRLKA